MRDIMVVGDIHGRFEKLNQVVDYHHPNMVISVGDFGYFPRWHGDQYYTESGVLKTIDQYSIFTNDVPIYWCDGNHEDFDALKSLNIDKSPYLMEDFYKKCGSYVYYMKRGSVLTLKDGRNVMFMGGGYSIDRNFRVKGISYWDEEMITEKDIENLPDIKIDIVISHTAPIDFNFPSGKGIPDKSRDLLQYVFEKYHPKFWYFGHFHKYNAGIYKKCRWYGLAHNDSMSDKWWMWMK